VVLNIIVVALQLVCYDPHCTLNPLMGTSISWSYWTCTLCSGEFWSRGQV